MTRDQKRILFLGCIPFLAVLFFLFSGPKEDSFPFPDQALAGESPLAAPEGSYLPQAKGRPSPSSSRPSLDSGPSRRSAWRKGPWQAVMGGFRGRILRADGSPAPGLTVEAYTGTKSAFSLFAGKPKGRLSPYQIDFNYYDAIRDPYAWFLREGSNYLDSSDFDSRLEWFERLPDPAAKGKTDDQGRFHLAPLPPGRKIFLLVRKDDLTLTPLFPFQRPEKGKVVSLGDFRLPSFRRVTGRVLDSKGEPLPGVLVAAFPDFRRAFLLGGLLCRQPQWLLNFPGFREEPPYLHRLPQGKFRFSRIWTLPQKRTDEEGRFTLDFVPWKEGCLSIFHRGGASPEWASFGPGNTTGEKALLVRIPEETGLSLQVVSEIGAPLAGVEVAAGWSPGPRQPVPLRIVGRTDGTGRILCKENWRGRIFFALRRGSRRPWTVSGPWAPGSSPVITLGPWGRKAFHCVQEGEKAPVTPERITVTYYGDPTPLELETRILGNGSFALDGLPPGQYLVKVEKSGFLSSRREFQVRPGEMEGGESLEIVLHRKTTLSVLVTDKKGTPLPGARVTAFGWFPEKKERDPFFAGPVETGRAGKARLGAVPRATIQIVAAHPDFPLPREKTFEPPFSEPLKVVLPPPGRVEGKVRGFPPRQGSRFLYAFLEPCEESLNWIFSPVDEEGAFSLSFLPPGDYTIGIFYAPKTVTNLLNRCLSYSSLEFDSLPKKDVHVPPGGTVRVVLAGPDASRTGSVSFCGTSRPPWTGSGSSPPALRFGTGSGTQSCPRTWWRRCARPRRPWRPPRPRGGRCVPPRCSRTVLIPSPGFSRANSTSSRSTFPPQC